MTNSELKKKNWKEVKGKFLEKVPKRFKVRVEGLEDDTKYYHPIIELDQELIIKGQGDIGTSYIYGLNLEIAKQLTVGCFLYNASLSIDSDDHFEYLMENYEKVRASLMESLLEIEKIYILEDDLRKVQKNIIYNAVAKEVDKAKLKDSIDKLYSVTEYLENKRLNI